MMCSVVSVAQLAPRVPQFELSHRELFEQLTTHFWHVLMRPVIF